MLCQSVNQSAFSAFRVACQYDPEVPELFDLMQCITAYFQNRPGAGVSNLNFS